MAWAGPAPGSRLLFHQRPGWERSDLQPSRQGQDEGRCLRHGGRGVHELGHLGRNRLRGRGRVRGQTGGQRDARHVGCGRGRQSLEDRRVGTDRVVIGTRGSALALWQADHVAGLLRAAHPGLVVERSIIVTTGDRTPQGPVWEAGGKAVWVKEIEAALLANEIDLAVHSLKDVPAELAPGLVLAAIPARADVRDALVSHDGATLADLPVSARVGTTSLRRICQVKELRPDLCLLPLRGNLDTRVRKVAEGRVDAAVLACAGLDRLGFFQNNGERVSGGGM